jgi:polar amino acid transport system ATP-binding protein
MLEIKGLRKRFGNTEVLKGIDLSLKKGEVLSIIGSSGGGKTTLLRCLNFLETADSGEIVVGGKSVYSAKEGEKPLVTPEAQLSFGLVFQQFNLFPQYNVMDNLMLAPKLRAKRKSTQGPRETQEEIRARAEELLATIGLTDKANNYPCELSGGQQQRVAIARALMLSPDILCFDEPTSALDPELTGEVLRVIRSLKDSERTMIIVTHEMEFARHVSDKVIFITDGVIAEMGTPEEIFDHPQTEKLQAFLSHTKSDKEFN